MASLLSTSYFQKYVIKKGNIVGYVLSNDSDIVLQKYVNKKKKTTDTEELLTAHVGLERILGKNGVDVKPVDF